MFKTRRVAARWATVGALALGSALALGACGSGGAFLLTGASATPTLSTILQKAQKATYKDTTFTMDLKATTSGQAFTGKGNGEETTTPKRVKFILTLSAGGLSLDTTTIYDNASGASYTQIKGLPGTNPNTWSKSSSGASIVDIASPNALVDFSKVQNAKLVGTTTKNGVAVWHVSGNYTQGTTAANIDAYIRESDYLPAEEVVSSTGSTASDITIDFTKYNSGITIDLPPASSVTGG